MKRRAAAIFVVLAGGLLLGGLFVRSPVEVTVVYQLGAWAHGVREIDVRYLRARDRREERHVTWHFQSDPPAELEHRTRLSPGDYVLDIAFDGKSITRDRSFHLEGSGRAFVDLRN